MSDQQKTMSQRFHDSAPISGQVIRFLTAVTIGVVLLGVSGLTLTGTVIALVIATPVLVLFSPILIPAGIVLTLVTGGFLFAGGCGVAALAALLWIYRYVAGKHPVGSDQLDYARMRIANKARDVKDRAKEYGNQAQKEITVERAKEYGNQAKEYGSQAQAQKETAMERSKEYGNQANDYGNQVKEYGNQAQAQAQKESAVERAKEYGNQAQVQKESAVERAKEYGNQAQAQKETAVEKAKEYGNQAQTQKETAIERAKEYYGNKAQAQKENAVQGS